MKKLNIYEQHKGDILFTDTRRNLELAEYCQRELFEGYSSNEFAALVKQAGLSEKCSVVWPAKTFAFRCYTCSFHPNVAICKECFDFSKHENHNYTHFESLGGVCDCGDKEALKAEGFCDNHGLTVAMSSPPALLKKANKIIRIAIVKCAHLCSLGEKDNIFLNVLKEWTEMGYFIQKTTAKNLLDEELYEEYYHKLNLNFDLFEERNKTIQFLNNINPQFSISSPFSNLLTRRNFLYWLFIYFMTFTSDESFCDFILTLLPVKEFKEVLTNVFFQNYPYLIRKYLENEKHYFNRMNKMSIQLLSSSSSVQNILRNHSFMEIVLLIISPVIDRFKTFSTPWPAVQDFLNLISNKEAIEYFLRSTFCINTMLENAFKLQGRFMFERQLNAHVEYDNLLSFEYFNTETEICTLPVCTMLPHCDNMQKFLDQSIKTLLSWTNDHLKVGENEMTFNLPLHRIVSLLLSHQLRNGHLSTDEHCIDENECKQMLEYPFRTIAAVSEILCKFWKRNGRIMEEQAILYKRPVFSASTYDPDLFLIQYLSSRLGPDYFVESFLEKFSVLQNLERSNWFKRISTQNMLEEALFFLATIISCRVLSGEDGDSSVEEELIGMLSISERTHEEILEFLPNRGPLLNVQWETSAEAILNQIADYRAPQIDNLNEPTVGQYFIKDDVLLNSYDPVFVRMRSLSIAEYAASLEKYFERIKRNNLKTSDNLWPPFRIPENPIHPFLKESTNFLHSFLMHAFIFVLLHKCLQSEQTDGVLQITIHLLHMTLVFPYIEPADFFSMPTVGNIYETCLVPMNTEHNVLAPHGLDTLFHEIWLVGSSETSIFPPEGYGSTSEETDAPSSSAIFADQSTNDLTILSMLLKLYQRYSKKVYRPSDDCEEKRGSMRIGGGEYYIGEVLNKLVSGSREVRRVVEELTREDDSEAKKAALDRKKMLAKNKMKKMMEKRREKSKKAFAEEGLEIDSEEDEDEETQMCCICNSQLHASATNPICLLALLSKTNIMGLRRTKESSDNTFSDYSRSLQSHIERLFPDMNFDLNWYRNGILQTCGHLLHKNCYLSHMENEKLQKKSSINMYLLDFNCPICRQLCNTILPLPADQPIETTDETTPSYEFLVEAFRLLTPLPKCSVELLEIAFFYKDIINIKEPFNKELIKLFRNNVEIELMTKGFVTEQRNNLNTEISYQPKTTRKTHLGALRALCSNYLRRGDYNWPFPQVLEPFETSIENGERSYICILDLKQCLAEVTLYHFYPTTGSIRTIVIFFINCFVVNMIAWIVLCTDEKVIIKWIEKANLSTCPFGELLAKAINIVGCYDHERKKYNVAKLSVKVIRIFSDFLRFCVLVYNSVVNPSRPTVENIETMEMSELLSVILEDQCDNSLCSIRCYGWDASLSEFYLNKYLSSVGSLLGVNKELKIMKKLTMESWETPNFITLPLSFRDFQAEYSDPERKKKENEMVCIICGYQDTFKDEYTSVMRKQFKFIEKEIDMKLGMHASMCGNGTCIFVGNVDNRTMIFKDFKLRVWKSLYVNRYGEDDPKFKYGRKLKLNLNRMHYLRCLWICNQLEKLFEAEYII